MRYRKPQEAAIEKLQRFLEALQHKCDGTDFVNYTSSQLHIAFKVSKSTFSVCKKLEIVKEIKGQLHWQKENPNREMCLQILSVLLEQSKKERLTPIDAQWTAINSVLQDISEKISIGIQNNNNRLQGFKTPQKEPSLFDSQEKKTDQRFELIKAIASGVYQFATPFIIKGEDSATIDSTNQFILEAVEDLLNKATSQK